MAMRYGNPIRIEEMKATGDDWLVSGYASTFGNVDLGGDTVVEGAFRRSLKENPTPKFLHSHDPRMVLGVTKSLREDSKGLLGTWKISKTQLGEDTHTLLQDGALDSFSIGYIARGWEWQQGAKSEQEVRLLKDVDLLEVSLVAMPMNPAATVTGVKELDGAPDVADVKATWDTAYVNGLPDAAFAGIMPGGKKDDEGKTVPRSLRRLPHHDASVTNGSDNDSVDLPHLRNALARAPQMDAPEEFVRSCVAHLNRHAKALKVGQDSLDLTLVEQAGLVRVGLESLAAELATLAGKGHELSAAKRQELAALRETFSQVDAVRQGISVLLDDTPDKDAEAASGNLRLEIARRRLRHAGILEG